MKAISVFLIIIFISFVHTNNKSSVSNRKLPTVFITILVRNKAHTLPYFLSYLENQNYPKNRLSLWIRSDHNEDNSVEILQIWLNRTASLYNNVDFQYKDDATQYQNDSSQAHWSKERYAHVIKLKEDAIERANRQWADHIFFIDADVFLTNPNALKYLTAYDAPIVAPMLVSDGLYSNFWCGMSDDYYYQRTDEYKEIYEFKKTGNYPVPMVHTAVLINLNYPRSDLLTFDREKLISNQKRLNLTTSIYDGPLDDIIIFAISANSSGIEMLISNEHQYGYILLPLEKDDNISLDYQQLVNTKVAMITDLSDGLRINEEFQKFVFYPEKDRISLDHIYMINLERRPERRIKMENAFKELGLEVEYFPAVDGRKLNLEKIAEMGIVFLTGYEDPYNHRQMTMGEIGCFLSHYEIWEKMVELGQNEVLILEDDIRFEPYFKEKAIKVLNQVRTIKNWDLVYFGRKRLDDQDEPWVEGLDNLVHVGYSYWTLGYVLSLNGAKKLLNVKPLKKLVPVDEFLPIMFDRHSNSTWKNAFEPRNLQAFSAVPLLLYPTHYTGDEGYISDTEDSLVTPVKFGESDAQLKSDKARVLDDFESHLSDDHMDRKHEERSYINSISKHDANEL